MSLKPLTADSRFSDFKDPAPSFLIKADEQFSFKLEMDVIYTYFGDYQTTQVLRPKSGGPYLVVDFATHTWIRDITPAIHLANDLGDL